MTKEDLATLLNGKRYREEIPPELLLQAKENGLVIVYGHSDDLTELEGAITDEFGCYEGGVFRLDKEGIVPDREMMEEDEDDDEAMEAWLKRKKAAKKIEAVWCAENEPSWTFKTDIPHATFNVMEDDEVQCRGIVFSVADL